MPSKTDHSLNNNSYLKKRKRLPDFLLLLFIILPVVLTAIYTCYQIFRDTQNFTLARREAIASLTASTVKEKLDRVVDLGISLASRVQFQKLVKSKDWNEAILIMQRVPKEFPDIARVALFDKQGFLRAATDPTPELLSVIGENFSYRDYYQGVSKNWKPYVAEAIKPAVPLGYNLVPVAIPITTETQEVLGFLLLNLKLDTIALWARSIDVGPGGFVYIVNQRGNLIAHPSLLPAEDIVDFSSVPSVQKVLKGDRGVEVNFNPVESEERLAAWAPVPAYGWGVVVSQPARLAFAERNRVVGIFITIWSLVILAAGFFTYLLLRDKAKIRRQRDRERLLLESIGEGIMAIDRHWNITLWNKAAERITGFAREEVLGKPFREVVRILYESSRKENIVFIEEALLFKEVRYMSDHTVLVSKDGRDVPIGDSAAPILDAKGNVAGAIIVLRDATIEREAMSLRSDFTYAAHQLRTPVTKAIWAMEVALGEEERPGVRKRMEDAFFALRSVVRLNDQLVAVSQIDQGLIHPKLEEVDLAEFTASFLNDMRIQAQARNLSVELSPPPPPISLMSDRTMLQRVLAEIMDNALAYSNPKSAVRLGITLRDDGLLFQITNAGPGIPDPEKALIFTKFFRGSNIDTTRIVGAGLGLYIAKTYVKLLGGKIWFESEQDGETIFYVLMPIAKKSNRAH